MRNHKSAGNAECRFVFEERSGAYEHVLPLEVSCGETMVILKLPSDDEFMVIGRLSEMDSDHIGFDYVVLDRTLEDKIGFEGTVLLKRDWDLLDSIERVSCVIESDVEESGASFSSLRIRKCVVRRIGQ